jgi:hypothetical protein
MGGIIGNDPARQRGLQWINTAPARFRIVSTAAINELLLTDVED